MEFDPKDMDVIAWLAKLKSAEVRYPSELFASRRLGYTRKVAEIGLGLGISAELKDTPRAASGGGAATTIGGVFETILMVAIVAEASAAAYFYRDQIADFIRSYLSPTLVTDASPPPEEASPLLDFTSTEVPDITETPIPTITITATSLPTLIIEQNEQADNPQAVATSNPNGNNGNHYGQTPKPERTKEKGNNDGGGGDDDKGKGKDK